MARPDQVDHGWLHGKIVRLNADQFLPGYRPSVGPAVPDRTFKAGERMKCVMVSRMGDIGLTRKLDAENGYELRVLPEDVEAEWEQA